MTIIVNLLLVAFILAMAYWWSSQGFFSAMIHLGVVIVSGTLAWAFFEPLAYWLLGTESLAMRFAWGISLLAVFIVCLAVLRQVIDRIVRGNVQLTGIFNLIFGGACGVGSAILTAGIIFLGLSYMPLPVNIAGYQPYAATTTGQLVEGDGGLWLDVDQWTADFFTTLSGGAFATRTPLATHRPQVVKQAALFRLRPDPNSSIVAPPGSVTLGDCYSLDLPASEIDAGMLDRLGEEARSRDHKLVIVDTDWQKMAGTYDAGTLRLPPTQARLVTRTGSADPVLHAPLGYAQQVNFETGERHFYRFGDEQPFAFGLSPTETIAWIFIVPVDAQPLHTVVRALRFDWPKEPITQPAKVAAALGKPAPTESEADDQPAEGTVGAREGVVTGHVADAIELTNMLPQAFSANDAMGLRATDGAIESGSATVSGEAGRLSSRTRIDRIYTPAQLRMVRLRLQPDEAQSFLGSAVGSAARLNTVWLKDNRGQSWYAVAYVLKKPKEQQIWVNLDSPIRSASQLPVSQMSSGDELYLYFHVQPGVVIETYHLGSRTQQSVQLTIPR